MGEATRATRLVVFFECGCVLESDQPSDAAAEALRGSAEHAMCPLHHKGIALSNMVHLPQEADQ